jgi:hypothetical protein
MSIADEYMRTIWPELWNEHSAKWESLAALMSEAGQSEEARRAAWRSIWRENLAAYDDSILRFFGKDVDFLLDAIEQKAANTRGGKELRQHQAAMRREAYHAFAEVAATGGKRRDAVRTALDRIELISEHFQLDPKTVRSWWDAIEKMGCFKIQKRE